MRLVGGSWNGEGRVEIIHDGAWGTVCDDSWDKNDARVVCRALGYPDAISAPQSAHFGQGSGNILLDDVQCLGNESVIEYCPHGGWNSHNCGHSEDASTICLSMYDHVITIGLYLTCFLLAYVIVVLISGERECVILSSHCYIYFHVRRSRFCSCYCAFQ